jgi:hypothetical protein
VDPRWWCYDKSDTEWGWYWALDGDDGSRVNGGLAPDELTAAWVANWAGAQYKSEKAREAELAVLGKWEPDD